MVLAILPSTPPKPTNETREIQLHPAVSVGQDGILRAGWQPAPGGHSQRLKAGYQPAAGCQPAPQPGTFRHCILRASMSSATRKAHPARPRARTGSATAATSPPTVSLSRSTPKPPHVSIASCSVCSKSGRRSCPAGLARRQFLPPLRDGGPLSDRIAGAGFSLYLKIFR